MDAPFSLAIGKSDSTNKHVEADIVDKFSVTHDDPSAPRFLAKIQNNRQMNEVNEEGLVTQAIETNKT